MATIRRYRTAVFKSRSPTDTSATHTAARRVTLPNPFGSSRISLWGDLQGAEKEGSGRSGTVDGSTNGGFYHQMHLANPQIETQMDSRFGFIPEKLRVEHVDLL